MTNTTAELETRIEQMVAEHVAAVRTAAQAAVERAFAGASASVAAPTVAPSRPRVARVRAADLSDYPVGKAPYATRSVDSLINRSRGLGEHIGVYAERLLAGPLPWIKMRQGYGLIRLCERYGAERVDALCKRSLSFDVIDVPRIERMLKQAQKAEDAAPEGRVVPLPTSRFARDPASFATIAPGAPKGGE